MKREAIPAAGLGDYRLSLLRGEGFVAVPYQDGPLIGILTVFLPDVEMEKD